MKGISQMQLSHTRPVAAATFDDPNLVSTAGLAPVMALARQCDLAELADEHLSVPTDKGANAGRKIGSLVAGRVAGADSIADMAILRLGAMKTLFTPTHPRRWVRSCTSSPSGTCANSTPWLHAFCSTSAKPPHS